MWSYQYKHGDRPLEGYTIQRAAGRGGFGEVYYAVSDTGREVALKAITTFESIELRGISQCMNLKSPHLVTVFDVRYNDQGRPFVLMEYVSGPNLRQLLDDAPAGLGTQKAAFFLREIGKGLSYLHDCGIVHRDLKPANIFYENGYVKIGDYGLSKAISPTQHSGQTVTVGTVHYMAPEIGAGRYDRSIDIYALGALLYEMLTGTVPFVGSSAGEILIKHISDEPDVSGIPQPFASVIKRAMAKDPAQRFATVQEMVEAVFGAEHVRTSVSQFSPEDLSLIAERVAAKVRADEGSSVTTPPHVAGREPGWRMEFQPPRMPGPFGAVPPVPPIPPAPPHASPTASNVLATRADPLPLPQRMFFAAGIGIAGALLATFIGGQEAKALPVVFMGIWGVVAGSMLVTHVVLPRLANETPLFQKMITGVTIAACAMVTTGPMLIAELMSKGTIVPLIIPWFFMELKKATRPMRKERVEFWEFPFLLAIWGVAALPFGGGISGVFTATLMLCTCGVAIQLLAPWLAHGVPVTPRPAAPSGLSHRGGQRSSTRPTSASSVERSRPVWRFAPLAWAIACILTLALSIVMYVVAGNQQNDGPLFRFVWLGLLLSQVAIVSFVRAFTGRFTGWWPYLLKPLALIGCVQVILGSSFWLAMDEAQPIAIGLIVIAGSTFLFLLFADHLLIREFRRERVRKAAVTEPSPQQRLWALILAGGGFFAGINGLHHFYVGRVGTGILYLCTFGLFGIGQIIDIILIASGRFKDAQGRSVTNWETSQDLNVQRLWSTWSRGETNAASGNEPTSVAGAMSDVPTGGATAAAAVSARSARRSHLAGLAAVVASKFIFITMIISLLMALDAPAFIAAGLPDPDVRVELETNLFVDYPQWPRLVHRVADIVVAVLMIVAVNAIIFARRRSGFTHIVRGVIGAALLPAALGPLEWLFRTNTDLWPAVAGHVAAGHTPMGVELVLDLLETSTSLLSAGVFVLGIILLAWPARPEDGAERERRERQSLASRMRFDFETDDQHRAAGTAPTSTPTSSDSGSGSAPVGAGDAKEAGR